MQPGTAFYGGFGDVVRVVRAAPRARRPASPSRARRGRGAELVFDVLTWEARARAESARRERAR